MKSVIAVVETPKGSAQKYSYNEQKRWFELKKILPAGMVFPFDFGFIPDTKGEDGDPIDVIIISELKSFPGCVMSCRLVGAIEAEQEEKGKKIRNDRLLAIPEVSKMFENIKNIDDLPKDIVVQIEDFFINYNKISKKQFNPIRTVGSDKAKQLIKTN